MENNSFRNEYYIKDLPIAIGTGNVRVCFTDTYDDVHNRKVKLLQTNAYYPFGMTMTLGNNDNKYKYNGKELQDEFGLEWYDYGARMYDPALARWHFVDPLAHEREWLSPYNYCQNNPLNRVDPNGALDDGYQDMQGNYKWFDDETADVIGRDDKLWVKVTDDRNIFDMAAEGIFDNVPKTTDPVQITETDNLTSFEMWLDFPSESVGESIVKIGANIGYSLVNSPYSLLTGETIGGTSLNPIEKMDVFVDFVPGLISGGLTKTAQVVKTTKKGLQGFNQFVKNTPGITTAKGLPKRMIWQTRAGKLFQTNKLQQQGLKTMKQNRKAISIIGTTKKELEK